MHTSAFNFQTLSPDVIIDALESIGIRAESGLTALNSYENRVYQFAGEDRRRLVVKFYRPERWSITQITEEHQFLQELQAAEIPVVAPLQLEGETVQTYAGFFFTVFPSAGGRVYEMDNLDQLEGVGRALGRIHRIGAERLFQHRPTITLEEYLFEPREVLAQSTLIAGKQHTAFLQALDELISATQACWHTDWQRVRLHGDCHPGNILWQDGPLLVDLDDARNGPAIQDLWMLLHGERSEQLMQLDILLEAYGEFADFDQRQLALIEPLRAMRMVYYLAWVTRRWQDPAFPKNFPWMSDPDFWLKQTQLFIGQVKLLREPPLQLMPMY